MSNNDIGIHIDTSDTPEPNEREKVVILQELDITFRNRRESGKGLYEDEDEYYQDVCKEFERLGIKTPTLSYVKKHRYIIPFRIAKDKTTNESFRVINAAAETLELESKEESAIRRHAVSGWSLYTPYLTHEALRLLDEISMKAARRIYELMAGYVHISTGITYKRSRNEYMELLGISRRTWQRAMVELREKGLVESTENDTGWYDHKVSFSLPHVKDWHHNVERPLDHHRKGKKNLKNDK